MDPSATTENHMVLFVSIALLVCVCFEYCLLWTV